MAIFGNGNGSALREAEELNEHLREHLIAAGATIDYMQESFRDMELAMQDDGWRRMGMVMEREFTRAGLDDATKMSRAMYMSNPLIQRAISVTTFYVWGQGVEIHANNPKVNEEIVQPHLEDYGNRRILYGPQSQVLAEVDQMVDGNTFTALFTDDEANVKVRQIPTEEVREIICKPGDHGIPWFYHRVWVDNRIDMQRGTIIPTQKEAYYPDYNYLPVHQAGSLNGIDIRWDSPIIHQRTGGLRSMKFGFPETYAAIDWARAYRKFLQDWHSIINSLAKFAMTHTTTDKKIASTRDKYEEELGGNSGELEEMDLQRGRRRDVGNVAVLGPKDKIAPLPRSGAMTSAEDAKASRLMVASAMNLPDPMLSNDPQQGALATARTLDRPTELGMRFRQGMQGDMRKEILRYNVIMKVREDKLPGKSRRYEGQWEFEPEEDPELRVIFPPILEHDPKDTVTAIVTAATLAGNLPAGTIPREVLSKALMTAVGIEDIDSAIKALPEEDQILAHQAAAAALKAASDPKPDPSKEPPPSE